ncbi:MAG: T9SS type A sorting domain-containing protein [Bacteroidales bacterium]|nr:T9SS type A sorting domain-containing protein [Candidatus Physcocola equi]
MFLLLKKTYRLIICLSVLQVCSLHGYSQSAVVAGGGSFFSPQTGGISASIGQTGYQYTTNENSESLSAGVQQTYIEPDKDTKSSNYEDQSISIRIAPNPTTDFCTVLVEGRDISSLDFTICDMAGRELKRNAIDSNNRVSFEEFSQGVYLLRVKGNVPNCSYIFKIIKE